MEAHQETHRRMNNESRIIRVETVIEHIKYMLERTDARFDALDDKMSKLSTKFDSSIYWLIGIGVTSLISVFGAIINIALKLQTG